MSSMQITLVLTGGIAGDTIKLMGRQFTNGEHTFEANEKDTAGLVRYYGRSYQAFPKGSRELAHYQQFDKKVDHGPSETDSNSGGGQADPVPSGVQSNGTGSATQGNADGGGAAGAEAGNAGSGAEGGGQQHSGDDGNKADADRLQQALDSLDPQNDEHWTADGRPRIDALVTLSGITDLTRAVVETLAPNFSR